MTRPSAGNSPILVPAPGPLRPGTPNRIWVISRFIFLSIILRLCRIRPAHRPATARSWSLLPVRNPKIGFGSTPDPGRTGRRRGQVWDTACRALRGCVGYDPPIGWQQPDLVSGSRPTTARNPKLGFVLSSDPGRPLSPPRRRVQPLAS